MAKKIAEENVVKSKRGIKKKEETPVATTSVEQENVMEEKDKEAEETSNSEEKVVEKEEIKEEKKPTKKKTTTKKKTSSKEKKTESNDKKEDKTMLIIEEPDKDPKIYTNVVDFMRDFEELYPDYNYKNNFHTFVRSIMYLSEDADENIVISDWYHIIKVTKKCIYYNYLKQRLNTFNVIHEGKIFDDENLNKVIYTGKELAYAFQTFMDEKSNNGDLRIIAKELYEKYFVKAKFCPNKLGNYYISFSNNYYYITKVKNDENNINETNVILQRFYYFKNKFTKKYLVFNGNWKDIKEVSEWREASLFTEEEFQTIIGNQSVDLKVYNHYYAKVI